MNDTIGNSLRKIYKWSQWNPNQSETDKEAMLDNIRDEVKYLIDPEHNPWIDGKINFNTKWFEDLCAKKLPEPFQI
jgi:hypothetical protein